MREKIGFCWKPISIILIECKICHWVFCIINFKAMIVKGVSYGETYDPIVVAQMGKPHRKVVLDKLGD